MNRLSVEPVQPDPSEGHLTLRREAALELIKAAGVPAVLADPRAEAQGQREGFRRFVHATIEPMARIVEAELTAKTGLACALNFASLFAADLAGRARSSRWLKAAWPSRTPSTRLGSAAGMVDALNLAR